VALQPNAGYGLLIHEVFENTHTTRHSRYGSSGRVISPSQRPLPDNTQHSQQTDIHAPGGIRAHNLSRRAAVDLRLRLRRHWDRRRNLDYEIFILKKLHFWAKVKDNGVVFVTEEIFTDES
jgi:hypothetical protein